MLSTSFRNHDPLPVGVKYNEIIWFLVLPPLSIPHGLPIGNTEISM